MQKDNKISTLEAKLATSSPKPAQKQYAALKNPNMRQVQPGGKITKTADAEKIVIDTISKKPQTTPSVQPSNSKSE